jgi:hypothetical protein
MFDNIDLDKMCGSFEDELRKIAAEKLAAGEGYKKVVLPMLAGAVGFEAIRRANQDRKIGRQVRIQQQY